MLALLHLLALLPFRPGGRFSIRPGSSSRSWWLGVPLSALLAAASTNPALAEQRPVPTVTLTISGDCTEDQRENIRNHLSLGRVEASERLSEAVFQRLYAKAAREAAAALEPFGYYSPEIILSRQPPEDGYHVAIEVHVGRPVVLASMEITLNGPGREDVSLLEAIRHFPLKQGAVLDHRLYEQGKEELIAAALNLGYHRAVFAEHRVEVRKSEHSASLLLLLDTGPRYVFGPITFDTEVIGHYLLDKIAAVEPGTPFSPKTLTRLRQSLLNGDYFTNVELEYDLDRAQSLAVPVRVLLTPSPAHKYGIGLGYGTDTGARATLEYTHRRLNRLGHQLDLQLQPSERKSRFGGVYTIPVGDPKKDRLTLTGKYETETFDNTDTESLNATASLDHFRDWGDFSTYLQFLDERYTTGGVAAEKTFLIPGLKGSLIWADDRITTKRGIRFTATLIGSEDQVLADTSFLQFSLRSKAIYSFSDNWRILGRGEFGTTLVDDIYDLPPSLRFYAGGDQSVRGYGYKKIGPRDKDGNVIGGKDLLTWSLELERNLFDDWSAAVFYDSGAVSNDFSQLSFESGTGAGLRWNGVFGQVRLDVARALDDQGSWRIHLTMGADL